MSVDYQSLKMELNQSYIMYNKLIADYSKERIIYQYPSSNQSIVIWTIPQTIPSHQRKYWELLDTFVNHIALKTNATANVVVVDLGNYVNLSQGKTYFAVYNSTGTSFNYEMHLSQGCGGYVLVIFNRNEKLLLVTPNITATYAPTPFLTGNCSMP